jgi:LmbE family N-acetylglucosaminyl deacetylase
MTDKPLRLLVIGAHPDDCEVHAGGLALLYRRLGAAVKFVSTTNGNAGHHDMDRAALAKRRRDETRRVADRFGIEYDVYDVNDGELEPTLENRMAVIRTIRTFRPDLMVTHRPNDYHPDHRYTSMLVQDAAFCVTVPLICPDTPALRVNPVIAYMDDRFSKPTPFEPTVAVSIDEVADGLLEMLHCHESQAYEWIPFLHGTLDQVPADEEGRKAFLRRQWIDGRHDAGKWRDLLVKLYGRERGTSVRLAEAFEASEYGSRMDEATVRRLFPFFGPRA